MNTQKRNYCGGAIALNLLCCAALPLGLLLSGCGDGQEAAQTEPAATATLQGAIEIKPGTKLESLAYTIDGPNSFSKTGSVDVHSSTKPAFIVGGLPPGQGYAITLTGSTPAGATTCSGSATFDISAGVVTSVVIHLTCHESSKVGSVQINGTSNICPVNDYVSAMPAEAVVGGSIGLQGAAHDPDASPQDLVYTWSAPSGFGTFSDHSSPNPTFICAIAGEVPVTMEVSDGDCTGSTTVTVTCSNKCPLEDGNACTVGVCSGDGESTIQVPTEWQGCKAAIAGLPGACTAPIEESQQPELEKCAMELGESIASSENPAETDAHWKKFDRCFDAARGCESTPSEGRLQQALTVFNSNICKQTQFSTCRQAARDEFVKHATICLVVGMVHKNVLSVKACITGALALELHDINKCAQDASCTPSQMCVQEMCIDPPGIEVLSASYGSGSCGTPIGNVTGSVAGTCNGRTACDVYVHNGVFGDPSYGCPKDFLAEYRCGSDPGVRSVSHGAVAGEGYSVNLDCN